MSDAPTMPDVPDVPDVPGVPAGSSRAASSASVETSGDDVGDDIRLIGRLIGEVVREQAGDDMFDLVERVRRIAVHGRRAGENPIGSLTASLADVAVADQLHLIRAFGWLSLLANTAEDLHVERRRRFHRDAGSRAHEGTIEASLDKLVEGGVPSERIVAELAELSVSPVITAHPTEVRRKTVLDHVDAVAHLLDERGRSVTSATEIDEIDRQLELEVLMLWQTAMLRLSKLRVRDEINEALRYYRSSIFATVPALVRDVESSVAARFGTRVAQPACGFDGFVDRRRPRRQPVRDRRRAAHRSRSARRSRPIGHHLDGAARAVPELSMSSRLITPTGELQALADVVGRRLAVPGRRAISACAARHARPVVGDGRSRSGRGPRAAPPRPTRSVRLDRTARQRPRCGVDLAAVARRRRPSPTSVSTRCAGVSQIFGTHLCGLDMRQNSAVHEDVDRRAARASPGSTTTTWRSPRLNASALLTPRAAGAAAARHTVRRPTPTPPPASSRCSARPPPPTPDSGHAQCRTT